MRWARVVLYTVCFLLPLTCAEAQKINWNVEGLRELDKGIAGLPVKDQKGIVSALKLKLEQLRAERMKTAASILFLVQGVGDICGANNCAFWILDANYRTLLYSTTQSFKVLSTSHDGLPDIITSMHGSVDLSDLIYWTFHSKKYVRVACADVEYADSGGNKYKRPHITQLTQRQCRAR